jgi:hypothetical protein
MLQECLSQPGWATTPKMIVVAGTLDANNTINLAPLPPTLTPETEKAWAEVEVTVDLTENELEVIDKCIQVHISKGAFRATKYSKQLMEEFCDIK